MGRVTREWRREGVPAPRNARALADAAARRDVSAFASEFQSYRAQLQDEGYPPPALMGWLDAETGEVS